MKLHRRAVRVGGKSLTVITPRPGMDCRFSTNYYHDTWHLLSDWRGARFLARLLWGLAFQRVPDTVVLLGRPWLDPDPFDALPADPVALVPAALTSVRAGEARAIRRAVGNRRAPGTPRPDGTVRWLTHGLDAAVAAERARRAGPGRATGPGPPPVSWERVERVGGLLVLAATPDRLRGLAVAVHQLPDFPYQGMSYLEVGEWGDRDGEVQVFADYRRRVSASRVARREVAAEVAAGRVTGRTAGDLAPLIWDRAAAVRSR